MLLLLLIAAIALQIWAWRHLRRRVLAGKLGRLRASLEYGAWALAPAFLFAGAFFGLVGLEELTGAALVSEPLGRAALPLAALLLGVGLVGWLGFSIGCSLIQRKPQSRP